MDSLAHTKHVRGLADALPRQTAAVIVNMQMFLHIAASSGYMCQNVRNEITSKENFLDI